MSRKREISRRQLLKLSFATSGYALFAACGGAQAPSSAATPTAARVPTAAPVTATPAGPPAQVSVVLDWTPGSTHSAFYVAKDKGWYTDSGLDVTIRGGQGSLAAAQLVGAGTVTFGHVAGDALVRGVAQGIPVRSVALAGAKSPLGFTYAQDVIQTPKDMEGKTYATAPGSATFQMWPAFAAAKGIDASKVKVVNVSAGATAQIVATKQADFTDGAIGADEFLITKLGRPASIFLLAEHGFTNFVGHAIVANNSTIQQDPDMIRRFLEATLRAYDFVKANREEAFAIYTKLSGIPSTDHAHQKNQLEKRLPLFTAPAGAQTEQQWQGTIDLVVIHQKLATAPKVSDVFTNAFLPKR